MSIIDPNSVEPLQYSLLPLETPSENAVWKHFCKLMINGVVEDNEVVYCILCLEMDGIKSVYPSTTPTSNVREHLLTTHGMIELLDTETKNIPTSNTATENESQKTDTEYAEMDAETLFDQILKSSGGQRSNTRKYYDLLFDQEEKKSFYYCKFCLENSKKQRYQPNTATTNLAKHLKTYHLTELIKRAEGAEETDEPGPKRNCVKTSGVWKYYCKLTKDEEIIDENHIYCVKCLETNTNKKYKTTTSTGSLWKHIQLYHNIFPELKSDVEMQTSTVKETTNITKTAKKARRYFHKIGSDQNHYFCLVCLHQQRYQK